MQSSPAQRTNNILPSAFQLFDGDIFKRKIPVLFLDFDGTLAPIVEIPENAKLSDSVKQTLLKLTEKIRCAVITGRDRNDIEERISIDKIIYAGSHGYDIKGTSFRWIYEPGKSCLPALDMAYTQLVDLLADISGVRVERKTFAIAVHYRLAPEADVDRISHIVSSVLDCHKELKGGPGKKVLELKPDIDWHKGKALAWLMEHLNLSEDQYIPVFIGDDLTDEDAFAIVRNSGIGIIVGLHDYETKAAYSLKDTGEVETFLANLYLQIQ